MFKVGAKSESVSADRAAAEAILTQEEADEQAD